MCKPYGSTKRQTKSQQYWSLAELTRWWWRERLGFPLFKITRTQGCDLEKAAQPRHPYIDQCRKPKFSQMSTASMRQLIRMRSHPFGGRPSATFQCCQLARSKQMWWILMQPSTVPKRSPLNGKELSAFCRGCLVKKWNLTSWAMQQWCRLPLCGRWASSSCRPCPRSSFSPMSSISAQQSVVRRSGTGLCGCLLRCRSISSKRISFVSTCLGGDMNKKMNNGRMQRPGFGFIAFLLPT